MLFFPGKGSRATEEAELLFKKLLFTYSETKGLFGKHSLLSFFWEQAFFVTRVN
jgi:hypothetical protein